MTLTSWDNCVLFKKIGPNQLGREWQYDVIDPNQYGMLSLVYSKNPLYKSIWSWWRTKKDKTKKYWQEIICIIYINGGAENFFKIIRNGECIIYTTNLYMMQKISFKNLEYKLYSLCISYQRNFRKVVPYNFCAC